MGLLNIGLHPFNLPRSRVSYFVPLIFTPLLLHVIEENCWIVRNLAVLVIHKQNSSVLSAKNVD